jgi:hypothetical protein
MSGGIWTGALAALLALVPAGCGATHLDGSGGAAGSGAAGGGGGGTGAAGGAGGVPGLDQTDKIDLLFVIDNSISMADKQAIFTSTVPRLVQRLVAPRCLDFGGKPTGQVAPCPAGATPEFTPITDLHVGVVSSSLGSYGGNVCGDNPEPPLNDRARLLPTVRTGLVSHKGLGFLAWQSGGDPGALIGDVAQHVQAAGETGCGFEAPLEAWYRFLVDPDPHQDVSSTDGFQQVVSGIDSVVLEQRKQFLRPDSVVAIVMLSDENDCSIVAENGFVGSYLTKIDLSHVVARGTSQCGANPNDPCCRSCAAAPTPGCPDTDPECDKLPDPQSDKVNLRCWQQKRRYGIDFLYPTARYVNALRNQLLCSEKWDLDPSGCSPQALVPNPLFSDLTGKGTAAGRSSELIFLAAIVGVPWQDLATPATLNDPNALEYSTASDLHAQGRWDWITGDSVNPPDDPLMVESPQPRSGMHPLDSKLNPQPPSSTELANPANGHEWNAHQSVHGDLQYACIFPLDPPRDCLNATGGCDCQSASVFQGNSPLCQSGGTYSTLQVYAKAYPGLRQLEVLRDFGDNAIPASICPKITDPGSPSYGYAPAGDALIRAMAPRLLAK